MRKKSKTAIATKPGAWMQKNRRDSEYMSHLQCIITLKISPPSFIALHWTQKLNHFPFQMLSHRQFKVGVSLMVVLLMAKVLALRLCVRVHEMLCGINNVICNPEMLLWESGKF